VQILLRFPDFTNISRQKTVEVPTCTATEITEIAMALTRQMRKGNAPIRMITVTVTGLTDVEYAEQMNLLDPEAPIRRKKREGAERAMDSIREKYGKTAVQFGAQLREENNAVD
jgi:DNA polymerase-4